LLASKLVKGRVLMPFFGHYTSSITCTIPNKVIYIEIL
jgi:hypothetical protein